MYVLLASFFFPHMIKRKPHNVIIANLCWEAHSVERRNFYDNNSTNEGEVPELYRNKAIHTIVIKLVLISPGGTSGKEPTCQWTSIRDVGLIPGPRKAPGGGHGNPFQHSCLENLRDREAWWAIIHGVAKSQTLLKWLNTHNPNQIITSEDISQGNT